jgi:23S rRNA-/tRNA-specific pseudouridylate synthase
MFAPNRDGYKPKPLHRLDKHTTGVLLLGKNPKSCAHATKLFQSRGMDKTYWAFVVGRPDPLEGRIRAPLETVMEAGLARNHTLLFRLCSFVNFFRPNQAKNELSCDLKQRLDR